MKGLDFGLRVNSVKDLMSSFALLRTGFVVPPERETPQNE